MIFDMLQLRHMRYEIRIFQDNPHMGELGYFVDRKFFNKGISSVTVKELKKIAFEKLGLIRLEI